MRFLSHRALALVAGLATLLVAPIAESAQDTVTVGTAAGTPGSTVSVPISILDISGTPLGVEKSAGQRIQAFSIRVTYTPASAVSTLTLTRAGVTASLTPLYEASSAEGHSVSYLASFSEVGNPIPLTQPGSAPGDQVLTMSVTIASGATPGLSIKLVLDSRSTMLANQQGTIGESFAKGTLTLSSGTITVVAPPAITSLSATTFAIGSFNSFTVTTTGYPTPSISLTGALPSGVSFTDNGNGTATLSGIPAAGIGGKYPLTLTAHNGVGSDATQSFSLIVQNCYCYTLSTATSPSGVGSVTVNTAPNCGGNYVSGTGISLTANVPSGYMFAAWSGSGGRFSSTSANPTTFTITGTATVTATFTKLVGSKFYPLTPCRVVDTRSSIDPATVKRGTFTNGEIRAYTFSTSTDCPSLSSTAKAWVIHLSFQPLSQASYLIAYPDGATRPLASTILGYPNKWTGDNAVISAGSGGTIDLYSQYAGDVIIDVNGYFQ